ncbi:MAG: polysaccharide pyruvyl transferase family protein [bacterium]
MGKSPRVLMVGYNGANNTGAEALLLSDIVDMREVLGPDALITVPTLNEKNLRRYLKEEPRLRIAPIPTIYFFEVYKLVRQHDLIALVEGSTYMDTWGSALLWAFLSATWCARAMNKPCLAYAVDAGKLSHFNQQMVRRIASTTDLIITRAQAAADRLLTYGVKAPIEVTADNAFNFQIDSSDIGWPKRIWPELDKGLVGIAAVDFYLFPAVIRLWGRKQDCYKWPYYYSRSPERCRASQSLADGYAVLADEIIAKHNKSVALICMEQLDEPLAKAIHDRMKNKNRVRTFSSREYNASQMTVLLRSLELLITSRYHACVLSLAAQIPQVAVGHDLRLKTIYSDLGLKDNFFIEPDLNTMFPGLTLAIDRLIENPEIQKDALKRGYEEHLTRARHNRELLSEFIKNHGWKVFP